LDILDNATGYDDEIKALTAEVKSDIFECVNVVQVLEDRLYKMT